MQDLTDIIFKEQVIEKSKDTPVMVGFGSMNCGACQKVLPILMKMSKKYEGKLSFLPVNLDENPEISEKYDITATPTIKMYKQGNMVDEFRGYKSEQAIEKFITEYL